MCNFHVMVAKPFVLILVTVSVALEWQVQLPQIYPDPLHSPASGVIVLILSFKNI